MFVFFCLPFSRCLGLPSSFPRSDPVSKSSHAPLIGGVLGGIAGAAVIIVIIIGIWRTRSRASGGLGSGGGIPIRSRVQSVQSGQYGTNTFGAAFTPSTITRAQSAERRSVVGERETDMDMKEVV